MNETKFRYMIDSIGSKGIGDFDIGGEVYIQFRPHLVRMLKPWGFNDSLISTQIQLAMSSWSNFRNRQHRRIP